MYKRQLHTLAGEGLPASIIRNMGNVNRYLRLAAHIQYPPARFMLLFRIKVNAKKKDARIPYISAFFNSFSSLF